MERHSKAQGQGASPESPVLINIAQPTSPLAARLARALRDVEGAVVAYGSYDSHEVGAREGVSYATIVWAHDPEQTVREVKRLQEAGPPGVHVVVLSPREDPSLAWAVLKAGARGFIHTSMDDKEMAYAVVLAAQGELVVPRGLIGKLLVGEKPPDLSAMSARQREVLGLALEELSNPEIARRLYLSESTVKQHLRGAYKVLGVKNRREAARVVRKAREWEIGG